MVKEVGGFQGKAFDAKFFYNRSYQEELNETEAERIARCTQMFGRRSKFLGHVSEGTFVGICAIKDYPNWDLTESVLQVISKLPTTRL